MVSKEISIQVIALGPMDDRLLSIVAANVFAVYGLSAQVGRGGDVPQAAYDPHRNQYDVAVLLKHIENRQAVAANRQAVAANRQAVAANRQAVAGTKTIAITAVDIFVPIFSFVYGEARQGACAAVVSIHRLVDKPESPVDLYPRAVKVALHELGHLFDMPHCEDDLCLMHYADTLAAIDRQPLQFCRYCRAELPKC
jgi:archaemetzincin